MKVTGSNLVDSVVSAVGTVPSGVLDVRTADSWAIVVAATLDANAAGTWASSSVDTTLYQVTITAHGYKTGLVGQVTTAGTLPTGLSTSTSYYIIVVDANTVAFASSLANAKAGTRIHLTAAGAGNSTFTQTANSITIQPQWSLDQVIWINDGSATVVSATGNTGYKLAGPVPYSWYRLSYIAAAGSLTLATTIVINQAKQ